jgi:hypothetical protein
MCKLHHKSTKRYRNLATTPPYFSIFFEVDSVGRIKMAGLPLYLSLPLQVDSTCSGCFFNISQVRTMRTILTRLARVLKRSLKGSSKLLLEKSKFCVRDLLRGAYASQVAGGGMQGYRMVSIVDRSNSLQTNYVWVLQIARPESRYIFSHRPISLLGLEDPNIIGLRGLAAIFAV